MFLQTIFAILLLLGPFAALASPDALERAKEVIRETATKLAKGHLDHSGERALFDNLSAAVLRAELTDSEVVVLVSFATSSVEGRLVLERHTDHAIREERMQAAGASFEQFDFYAAPSRLREVVAQELSIVPQDRRRKILFIGGGPLPYSALYAQELTGNQIAICDCDQETLDSSRRFIQRMGLQDRFRFVSGAAETLDVSDYDLIWTAAMIRRKEESLRAMARTARPGSFFLVRQFEGVGQVLYGRAVDLTRVPNLAVVNQTMYDLSSCVRTLLLTPGDRNKLHATPSRD